MASRCMLGVPITSTVLITGSPVLEAWSPFADQAAHEEALPCPIDTLHPVVPYASEGGVDNLAGTAVNFLPTNLKFDTVVESRSEARTRTGAARLQRLKPDGSHVFMNAEPTAILVQLLFGGTCHVQTLEVDPRRLQ